MTNRLWTKGQALLRRRSGSVTALLVGAGTALLVGSVLAVASNSISITNNDVRSEPYDTPAPSLEMAVAPFNPFGTTGCADVPNYSSADTSQFVTQAFSAGFDWAGPDGQNASSVVSPQIICVRNAGNAPGTVSVSFSNVADTEVDNCAASEISAGDTTCAPGDAGELSPLLSPEVNSYSGATGGDSASCDGGGAWSTFASLEATPVVADATLAPGETCAIFVRVYAFPHTRPGGPPPLTEVDKLVSQTDSVTFDIVLSVHA